MADIDLNIFDKSSKNYLQTDKINKWLLQTSDILPDLATNDLIKIFKGLAQLKIFDNKFIKNLCDIMSSRLPDLSYSDATIIFFSLYELKYTKNIQFISKITNSLMQTQTCYSRASVVNIIWSLSKIGFYDEQFIESWIDLISRQIDRLSSREVTKTIQAIANLKIFDNNLMDLLLQKIDKENSTYEARTKLNIAFYLSMISINNSENGLETSKLNINHIIQNIMQDLDLRTIQGPIAKQQILQIHSSGIYKITKEDFDHFTREAQQKLVTKTSIIHKRIEYYIKKVCLGYKVIAEYYDSKTSSSIDLMVIRDENHPEYNVYLQVEGPTHYFINHQPNHATTMFNGATEYRNRLHKLHSIQTFPISYFEIDERSYFPKLLEKLHTFPAGYSPTIIEDINLNPKQAQAQKSYINTKSHKQKKKTKAESKVTNQDDFYKTLEEVENFYKAQNNHELTYDQIEKKYRKNLKIISLQKLLGDAVKHQNTDEIKVILNHYKKINPDEVNSLWNSESIIDLCEKILNKISNNYKESKIYIEIYALFLKYNYRPFILKENHLKALIYSYGYGDVEIFQNYLNLFPENLHKTQLMEYFMVNCGSSNNIQIANLLLLKNIDINVCYSRESAEVLYALAVGHKHNLKPLKNPHKVFRILFKLMTEDLDISSDGPRFIEDLFQLSSGGNLDRGEGIPEGRGVTALHLTSYNEKNSAMALFLLENAANPNTINKDGVTPLITALLLGNEKAALQILNFQPNVDLKALYDLTAAHIAARYGFIEVIKKIGNLKGNFDIPIKAEGFFHVKNNKGNDIKFNEDETPLWIALKEKHIELAKYLIEGKSNLDSHMQIIHQLYIGSTQLTPEPAMHSILTYCIFYYPELVKLLLRNGAKVNDDKIIGPSPLIIAAELSNPDTQLRNAKLFKDRKANKVYDMSVEFSKHNIFEALLLYGADVNFKDREGDTVSAYVSRPNIVSNHGKIISLIKLYEYFTGYTPQIRQSMISTIDPSIEVDPADLIMQEEKYSFSSYIPRYLKDIFSSTTDNTLMLENNDANSENLFTEIENFDEKPNIKSSKIDISSISTNIKTADIVIDAARLINRPNAEISYKFIYDVSYLASMLSGSGTPISLLLSSPHIANKIKQGDYAGAAVDTSLNIGLSMLSYTFSNLGFPVDSEFLSKMQTLLIASQLYNNIELLYEEITDPDNDIKSAELYQNIKYAFSDLFYSIQDMIGLNKIENHEDTL